MVSETVILSLTIVITLFLGYGTGDICIETFDPLFVTSLPNCTSNACPLIALDFQNGTGVWEPVLVHEYTQTANLTLSQQNITGCFSLVPSGFEPFQLNVFDETTNDDLAGFDICFDSDGEHVEYCTTECIEKKGAGAAKCIEASHYVSGSAGMFGGGCNSEGPSWCEQWALNPDNTECYSWSSGFNWLYYGAPNQTFAFGVCLCARVSETRVLLPTTSKFVRSCGSVGQFLRSPDTNDNPDVHVSVDDDILIIENKAKFDMECRASKDDWLDTIEVDKAETKKFSLPDRIFLRGGYLFVTCYGNHSKVEAVQIYLPAKKICRITDCLLCKEAFEDFSCLPLGHKIALCVLVGFAALLLIASCPCIYWLATGGAKTVYYILKYIFCCIFRGHKTRMGKWVKRKATGAYSKVQEGLEEDEEELASVAEPEKFSKKSRRKDSLFMFGVVFFLFVSMQMKPTFACEDVVVLSGSAEECEDAGAGAQNCTFVVNEDFIFNYIGQTVCIRLVDKGTDKEVASGSIKLEKVPVYWSVVKDYWTANWQPYYKSFKHCGNVDWCDSETCVDFLPNNTALLVSEGFGNIKWPGRSDCRALCGCAGCNCFYCSSACGVSRGFIEPTGYPIQVSHISSPVSAVRLTVNLKHGTHEDNLVYEMKIGEHQEVEGIKFTLSALDTPEIDTPKNKHLACQRGDQGCLFVQAAEKNIPSRALIGDIQADTDLKLSQMDVNSFIFDQSVISRVDGSASTSYVFAKTGYNTAWEAQRKSGEIPGTVDGRFWNFENNILSVEIENQISAQVVLSMTEDFKVQLVKSRVCPEVEIKDAGGCFECGLGFTVRILGYSSCESGIVTVESDNDAVEIFTTSFVFNSTKTEYLVQGRTNVRQNDFNLVFTGTQTTKSKVEFTGSVEKTINEQTYVKGIGEIKGDDGFDSTIVSPLGTTIDDSFKKAAEVSEWVHIVIWVAVALGAFVVIVIIGVILWKIDVKRFMPMMIKKKMV